MTTRTKRPHERSSLWPSKLSHLFTHKDTSVEEIPLTWPTDSGEDVKGRTNAPSSHSKVTTGWNISLLLLLFHGIISFLWGITLFIFMTGVVPIAWTLSNNYGQKHPDITNILVAIVASTTTMHITYIIQRIIEQYSHYLMVSGFTLAQLKWMEGVEGQSLFTHFPDIKGRGRFSRFMTRRQWVWLVTYAGLFIHTTSLTAILQPEIFIKNVPFNDQIPCPKDLKDLTFDTDVFLNDYTQFVLDTFSSDIGIQLANYGEQIAKNTTTSIAGRGYVKDNFAYGAIGGLINGLQEIPGVLFSAKCSNNTDDSESIWRTIFPDRTPPTLVPSDTPSTYSFKGDVSNTSELQSVFSTVGPFTLTRTRAAIYALVNSTGSGALFSVSSDASFSGQKTLSTLICSWNVSPKLLHVQMVNFTAGVLAPEDNDRYPALVGRSTLMTLQGMAQAYNVGSSLQKSTRTVYPPLRVYPRIDTPPNDAQVLETILADGGKASMTEYNAIFSLLRPQNMSLCNSNNRTVHEHWRFGNSQNLGWIAAIWTTGIGALAIAATIWFSSKSRIQDQNVLGAAEAFSLGRDDAKIPNDEVFCIRNGRVIRRRETVE